MSLLRLVYKEPGLLLGLPARPRSLPHLFPGKPAAPRGLYSGETHVAKKEYFLLTVMEDPGR